MTNPTTYTLIEQALFASLKCREYLALPHGTNRAAFEAMEAATLIRRAAFGIIAEPAPIVRQKKTADFLNVFGVHPAAAAFATCAV